MSTNPDDAVLKDVGRRVSADEGDAGYDAFMRTKNRRVESFLNGKLIKDVVTADERLGVIFRVKTDDSGQPVFNGDYIVHESIYGDVTTQDLD